MNMDIQTCETGAKSFTGRDIAGDTSNVVDHDLSRKAHRVAP